MTASIEQITGLLATRGDQLYGGEAVSQRAHALQCAQLAESGGASPALITASLLHDLGHLLHQFGDDPAATGRDDVHQYIALPFLRGLFGEDVLAPIRLHVDAKRYLCYNEPGYRDALSFASRRSLELQGGIYTATEAAAFIGQPFARDAVALRRWDDQAKSAGLPTPDLAHYATIMARCTCLASS